MYLYMCIYIYTPTAAHDGALQASLGMLLPSHRFKSLSKDEYYAQATVLRVAVPVRCPACCRTCLTIVSKHVVHKNMCTTRKLRTLC